MELTVNFRGVSIDLNSVALRNFVTLGKDGRVQVQKKTLAQQISAWSETSDEHRIVPGTASWITNAPSSNRTKAFSAALRGMARSAVNTIDGSKPSITTGSETFCG